MGREGQHPSQQAKRSGRLRRAGRLAAALIWISLLAAACSNGSGGPGVAGAGSPSSSASSSPSASAGGYQANALAYSQCMRDHGITDFPDPDANGQVNNPHLEEASGVVAEAQKACQDLLPDGESGDGTSNGGQAAREDAMLAYSQCMRDHGVSGFPDPVPDSGGGWIIPKNGEYDPLDPAVQAADKACLQSLRDADISPTEAPGD